MNTTYRVKYRPKPNGPVRSRITVQPTESAAKSWFDRLAEGTEMEFVSIKTEMQSGPNITG